MKYYKKLWLFGSSNSTPHVAVVPADSFWGLTAQALNIKEIVNFSWHGNSFDGVMHTLISNQNHYDWTNDLFLVGVPPLERWTIFDNHAGTVTPAYKFELDTWNEEQFEVDCFHGLVSLSFYNDKSTVMYEDRSWTETLAMKNIFLLNTWLDSVGANYLIINLSKNFDENNMWKPTEFLLPYCKNHQRNILFNNTYYSINENIYKPVDYDSYKWNGHHGVDGNRNYFENSILPTLKKCNLV